MARSAKRRLERGTAPPRRVVEDDELVGDAAHLGNHLPPVGRVHQDPQAHDDVERAIAELERVGVARLERDGDALGRGVSARHVEHIFGSIYGRHDAAAAGQEQRRAACPRSHVENAPALDAPDEIGDDAGLHARHDLADRPAEPLAVERPGHRRIAVDLVAVVIGAGRLSHARSFTTAIDGGGTSAAQACRVRSR